MSCPVAAFDKTSQKLYIFSSSNRALIIIDLDSEKMVKHVQVVDHDLGTQFACLVFAKGSLHLVGGDIDSRHLI